MIYLFYLLFLAVLCLCGGVRASHCGVLSCWGALGSVVLAHRLSCFLACVIFPEQGSNSCPLHWQAILFHCATREVPAQSDLLVDIIAAIILSLHKA